MHKASLYLLGQNVAGTTTPKCLLQPSSHSTTEIKGILDVNSVATCRARLKSEDVVQGKASLSDCKDLGVTLGATGRAKFASDNLSPVAVVK